MFRRRFVLRTLILIAAALAAGLPGHAQVPTPTPSPSPTNPPLAVVSAACLNPTNDMTLQKWAYVNGYLECETVDYQAEGIAAYKETPVGSGTFTLLIGTGGFLNPSDMVAYGVPSDTATALFLAMRAQP